MTLPVASVGVKVMYFLTSVTAIAAAVPMVPTLADVWVSTVSLRKRLPGAVNRMLFWASRSMVMNLIP